MRSANYLSGLWKGNDALRKEFIEVFEPVGIGTSAGDIVKAVVQYRRALLKAEVPVVETPEITGEPLPEGVPDVTKPVESIEELESEVQDNQFRAEQRTKDYLVDGVSYKRVSNVIGTTYSGEPDNSAIKAGNTVDDLVRSFFTEGETPVHDDTIMSKGAFDSLMKALGNVKKKIDDKGLRVLANNIVVWDDGSGVAGEVDLFVLNPETGNI